MVRADAVFGHVLFGVNDCPFVFVDEWRIPTPLVVPHLVDLPGQDLSLVEDWPEILGLRPVLSANHTEHVAAGRDEREFVAGSPLPA